MLNRMGLAHKLKLKKVHLEETREEDMKGLIGLYL